MVVNRIISNKRKGTGWNTKLVCDICGTRSTVYIKIDDVVYCKGCLLDFIKRIDNEILGKSDDSKWIYLYKIEYKGDK